MSRKPIICQIVIGLPRICCGEPADQIWKCEEILPHERHQVGEHTKLHERMGNGYPCDEVQRRLDEAGGLMHKAVVPPIKYTVIGLF